MNSNPVDGLICVMAAAAVGPQRESRPRPYTRAAIERHQAPLAHLPS
jgi:hypothetical protein